MYENDKRLKKYFLDKNYNLNRINDDEFPHIAPTIDFCIERLKKEGFSITDEIEKSFGEYVLVSEDYIIFSISLMKYMDISARDFYLNTKIPKKYLNVYFDSLFKYKKDNYYIIDNRVYHIFEQEYFIPIYQFVNKLINRLNERI